MARPRTGEAWISWVNEEIRKLKGRRWLEVPVGGLVLYPNDALADFDEPGWLILPTSGTTTFVADPDDGVDDEVDDSYPDLADALDSTTLPTQTALGPPSGFVYIIRAE